MSWRIRMNLSQISYKRNHSSSQLIIDKKPKISKSSPSFILVCGQNICGQLGFPTHIIERHKPQHLKLDENIRLIVAGALHSCALTVNGNVYTWGCNDDGALGRIIDNCDDEYTPSLFVLPEEIQEIDAGDSFTVALGKSRRAYICGCFRNSQGVLGLFDCKQIQYRAVVIPLDEPIRKIVCGADFCLVLTEQDNLYSFGNNETGQLARNNRESTWLQPCLVSCFPKQCVRNIWAGGHGCFILTQDSRFHLYSCGANSFGQLGHSSKSMISLPMEIEQFSSIDKLVKISCGLQHTLLLDSFGNVYGLGRSDDGRLGTHSTDDILRPTLIPNLHDIIDIAAGGCVSFAIDRFGEIYSFGMGDTCQTGHGNEDIFQARKVQSKQLIDRRIQQISVGAQHTIFLVRNV